MKNFLLAAALSLPVITCMAQNEKVINDKNAQKRDVKGFHAIQVSGGIDLYLTKGSDEAVAVSASNLSDRDRIKTEVEGGVLKIYMERGTFTMGHNNSKLKAYVSCKDLDALNASGGSDVYFEGEIKTSKLAIELSGGSDLKGGVAVGDLSIVQTGGSDVHINGTAASFKVHASGGSDLDGYGLVTDNCNVEASGGSDIKITANKELNVSASGGSDVYYKGSAVIKSLHSSGSSDVTKKS